MFKGYCFPEVNSWHTPAVNLSTPLEAVRYALLQSKVFKEVRVCDESDSIVIHSIDHKIVFPEEMKVWNKEEQ